MNPPEPSHRPAEADRVAAISRLVRRVCLLREQGNPAEAAELEATRLADEVRAHREASAPGALDDARLQQLFDTERARVAEAAILCELLVARLAEALPVASRATPPRRTVAKPIPLREAPASAGPPEIPELLDAMLAAERNSRRAPRDSRSAP